MRKKYYLQRDGNFYTKKTKQEIQDIIDPNNPQTFLPILEDMNYPYLEYEWNKYISRYGTNGIGRYISCMRLKGYQRYLWKDSTWINVYDKYRRDQEEERYKMFQVIDKRGSGKTSRLMLLAKENNGILVCSNPRAMEQKAKDYGLSGIEIISYYDYVKHQYLNNHKPIFIDELELFARWFNNNLQGYSLTVGE